MLVAAAAPRLECCVVCSAACDTFLSFIDGLVVLMNMHD
jgi:hypothetical protein